MLIDIKGQSFDIAPTIIASIMEAMEQTKNDGLEHGFLMCETPKGIVPGKKCTGNNCSVSLNGSCDGVGAPVGSFHSHPEVISFSLGDYVVSAKEAELNPEHKYLLCVSLLDKGVRCKALKQLPPKNLIPPTAFDSDKWRDKIKPYYTERVNISTDNLHNLLQGTPWNELPPSEGVEAIDEGSNVVKPGVEWLKGGLAKINLPQGGKIPLTPNIKNVVPAPSGKPFKGSWDIYPVLPPDFSPKYKSEIVGNSVVKVPIPPSVPVGGIQYIDLNDIEVPNPKAIALGESKGYADALTPIQLTEQKIDGKWKIHDGRHRLVAWKLAGHTKVAVQFVKPAPGSEATVYPE
jgi:uncharacterized ParB-like nuclease family protein